VRQRRRLRHLHRTPRRVLVSMLKCGDLRVGRLPSCSRIRRATQAKFESSVSLQKLSITVGDDTDTSVKFTPAPKSDREKDLESQIANTDDPDKKTDLQRELDYVRRQRERDDQRNKAIAEDAARDKKDRVDQDRMKGGSRFNLKFDGKVPPNITPQDIMAELSQ